MRILDPAVNALMLNNKGYDVHLELTTPDKLNMGLLVKPEEVFSYNTSKSKYLFKLQYKIKYSDIDGEFKLCVRIADKVFEDAAGIKSIKTKLFFSNEYYNCNLYLYFNYHGFI